MHTLRTLPFRNSFFSSSGGDDAGCASSPSVNFFISRYPHASFCLCFEPENFVKRKSLDFIANPLASFPLVSYPRFRDRRLLML